MSAAWVVMAEGMDEDDDVFVIGCDSGARALREDSFFCGGKFAGEWECCVAVMESWLVRAARADGLDRLAGRL